MKVETVHANARATGRRNAIFVGLLGVSLVANAGMAIGLATARQTILVPTLTSDLTIAGGAVSRDYLERLARDAAFAFLNRSPETERYFERQIERIAAPATYQEIRQALIADRLERQESRTSQVFFPQSFYVEPHELYVEVRGRVDTLNSREVVKSEFKTYGVTFERHGSLVLLASFVPLEKDNEKGANVRPLDEAES